MEIEKLKQAVLYPGFQAPAFPPNYYGQGANPVIGNTGITSFGVGNFASGTETLQNLAIPISGVPGVRQQSPMGPTGRAGNFNMEEMRPSDLMPTQDINNSGINYEDRN